MIAISIEKLEEITSSSIMVIELRVPSGLETGIEEVPDLNSSFTFSNCPYHYNSNPAVIENAKFLDQNSIGNLLRI